MRAFLVASIVAVAMAGSPWPASASQRAAATLANMNITDKLFLLHGYGGGYVGDVPPLPKFNLPPINLEDGPQGVADGVTQVTAWPSALTVVQSWDRQAMYDFGAAMGAEQKIKGTNVMLGPGINLARTPMCGRNFEYQGEDPYLAAQMVAPEVIGIQSNNVSACIKHYTVNVIETDRSGMSVQVDQRTWMETYSRGFQAAVDAGVGTAMCSYNRLNGTWACENPETLGYLYGDLGGFKGWMMSDWGATHSTVPAALAGLTQQMPDASFFGSALATAVANGQVTEADIDTMVTRILTPIYALNLADDPPTGNLGANATSDAHNKLARELAEKSTTLLKNSAGLLPLDKTKIKSVLILGDDSTFSGYGSGGVNFPYLINVYVGISTYLNGPMPPRPANCTFYPHTDFYQPGNPCQYANSLQGCCAICSANYGCNAFAYVDGSTCDFTKGSSRPKTQAAAGGACWLKPDTSGNRTSNGVTAGVCGPSPNPTGNYNVTYSATQDPATAAALAAAYDVVIMNLATTSGEGSDRADLSLPAWQDALVPAVAAANKNTVVLTRCPGACLMPWVDEVSAILFSLMPGQEAGNAIANVIFGDVNPSGKLPLTFPASMTDTWLSLPNPGGPINPQSYPGKVLGSDSFPTAILYEGLFFGYRWYDMQGTDPLWPFGHGLSYTTFSYTNLAVSGTVSSSSSATVTFTLTNTGAVAGAEVAQLYLGFPKETAEPPKLLRGFDKVSLAAGANAAVTFTVSAAEVQIWDTVSGSWVITPGTYAVYVGSSSRAINLTGSLTATA